jgi:ComF family protein
MAYPLLTWLRQVTDVSLDLIFPPLCIGCGRLGENFCPVCAQSVEPVPQPQCAHCGRPQLAPTARCANCRRHPNDPLRLTRTAALYTSPLRQAIHALKYEAQPELAPLLARYLIAVYASAPWSNLAQPITAVVPVPLHPQRIEERGYNQSELLAESFCAAVQLPLQPTWLKRVRETRQQVGLGPGERYANVEGAFCATADVAGQQLLLIDDVYTTGATLRACAIAALAAGATAVYGLTLAQPLRQAMPPVPDVTSDVSEELPWWEGEG